MDKPSAPTPADQVRWDVTGARHRVLCDEHAGDVARALQRRLKTERSEAMGDVDTSVNLAVQTCDNLSAMYVESPWLHAEGVDASTMQAVNDWFEDAQLWPLMDRCQRDTLGLREMLVHLDIEDGELVPRLVYPDCVVAECGTRPGVPETIKEVRTRKVEGKRQWLWDVLELTAESASFSVVSTLDSNAVDLTASLGVSSDAYRFSDGRPFLPYVVYRASRASKMWSYREWGGLFSATTMICIYLTYFGHGMLQASWAQRWMANGKVKGRKASAGAGVPTIDGSGGVTHFASRTGVTADPAVLLEFESSGDNEHPIQVGQFVPAVEPESILSAALSYLRNALESIGIDPAAVVRQSSDPRSGIALTVSREAQREAQKQWMPLFRASDLELVSKAIALRNRTTAGPAWPESGWKITYRSLPPTESELASKQSRMVEQMDNGLASPVDVYMELHPGTSREAATAELKRISAEKRRIEAG